MGSSELMNSTDQAGISPPDDIERLTSYRSSSAMIDALRPREPVYCLYTDTLVTEARRFLEGFPGRVLYAVKANPHPAVIAALWDAGVRHFDTASIPEIALVKAVAPEATCYFMAPSRLLGAAAEARFKYGVRHFVVDHPNALELLLEEVGGERSTTSRSLCEWPRRMAERCMSSPASLERKLRWLPSYCLMLPQRERSLRFRSIWAQW